MNIGRFLKRAATGVVKKARENPELALVVLSAAAPKVVSKVAPIIIAATRKPDA